MKPFLTRPLVLTFSSLFLILGSPSLAGEFSLKPASDSLDEGWSNNFALPGLDGTVKAFIVWQGDLYVGGRFAHADGVPVNGIARWDGTAWHALGNGVQGEVLELAVYDNMLAVSVLNANLDGSIAFWDGSNWTSTNLTFNHQGRAYALTVFDDKLVAAGNFNKVIGSITDTTSANNIAQWNGATWDTLGAGVGTSCTFCDKIFDLGVFQGKLVAGGAFSQAGGNPAADIAQWDGAGWAALGTGVDGTVDALLDAGTTLAVGGYFHTAGGVSVYSLAEWNGSQWSAMGSGNFGAVLAFSMHEGSLYGSGVLNGAYAIAAWDGSTWSPTGVGVENVQALASYGGKLVIGGQFLQTEDLADPYVMTWNGSALERLYGTPRRQGVNDRIYSVEPYGSDLVAAGEFTMAGGELANHLAKWNGTSWAPLGHGFDYGVFDLLAHDDLLYECGPSSVRGYSGVSVWNGSVWAALDSLTDGIIRALEFYDDKLVVAGQFHEIGGVAAHAIATWNGTSWEALGAGLTTQGYTDVWDLQVYNGLLVAGGSFSIAGEDSSARGVAAWNGTSWSKIGEGGVEGNVRCLGVLNGQLIVGGDHLTPVPLPIQSWNRTTISWDGAQWGTIGQDVMPEIFVLKTIDGILYEGGIAPNSPDPDSRSSLAFWNGQSWTIPDQGTDKLVFDIANYAGDLFAGGSFTMAGQVNSANIARYTPQTVPVAGVQNLGASRQGQDVVLSWSVSPDMGYSGFQVYRSNAASEREHIAGIPLSGEQRYVYRDRNAPAQRIDYLLSAQRRDGTAVWFGPLTVPDATQELRLSQNVPNPFRGSTAIDFNLPESQRVVLQVFDLSGREVASLFNGRAPAGASRVEWNGLDSSGKTVVPGVYFFRLKAGASVLSRKLMIVP